MMSYERDIFCPVRHARRVLERHERQVAEWNAAQARQQAAWEAEHGEENRRKEIEELKSDMVRITKRLKELS